MARLSAGDTAKTLGDTLVHAARGMRAVSVQASVGPTTTVDQQCSPQTERESTVHSPDHRDWPLSSGSVGSTQ